MRAEEEWQLGLIQMLRGVLSNKDCSARWLCGINLASPCSAEHLQVNLEHFPFNGCAGRLSPSSPGTAGAWQQGLGWRGQTAGAENTSEDESSCIRPAWEPPQGCPQPPKSIPAPRALTEFSSHAWSSVPRKSQAGAWPSVPELPRFPHPWTPPGTLWLKGWHSSPCCPRGVHIRRPRSQRLTAQHVPLPHCRSRSQAWERHKGNGGGAGGQRLPPNPWGAAKKSAPGDWVQILHGDLRER